MSPDGLQLKSLMMVDLVSSFFCPRQIFTNLQYLIASHASLHIGLVRKDKQASARQALHGQSVG